MNQKLFKKLNEQVEINTIKRVELTETEKKTVETKVIFEDFVKETDDLMRIEDNALSLQEGSESFFRKPFF